MEAHPLPLPWSPGLSLPAHPFFLTLFKLQDYSPIDALLISSSLKVLKDSGDFGWIKAILFNANISLFRTTK